MFGHSFIQKDIALFKQNLSALETLNKKHKLYSKVGSHAHTGTHTHTHRHAHTHTHTQVQFREHMLHPLLRILVEALVTRSHDLLQEEICLSVYSMAAVHFPSYHQQFVLQYLSSVEGLSDTHRSILAQQYKMVEVGQCIPPCVSGQVVSFWVVTAGSPLICAKSTAVRERPRLLHHSQPQCPRRLRKTQLTTRFCSPFYSPVNFYRRARQTFCGPAPLCNDVIAGACACMLDWRPTRDWNATFCSVIVYRQTDLAWCVYTRSRVHYVGTGRLERSEIV